MRRVLLTVVIAAGIASAIVLRQLGPSLLHASRPIQPISEVDQAGLDRFLQAQQEALRSQEVRPVYPYSVIPGGVRDARELKWAADHDPVVAAHYAGFDYDHARVVRLVLGRTVYVSYRIGNKIYWMRRRINLKKGETLLTDGRISARTRCGNRVEEAPQMPITVGEPPAMKFDEPIHPVLGTAIGNPPVPFQSSLLSPGPVLGPAPPLGVFEPFSPGTWVPVSPPSLPIPVGVCGPVKKKDAGADFAASASAFATKKKPVGPCGNEGQVPEPGTWLLVASGLAAMYWMARHRFART
jgi:hypothetical protein